MLPLSRDSPSYELIALLSYLSSAGSRAASLDQSLRYWKLTQLGWLRSCEKCTRTHIAMHALAETTHTIKDLGTCIQVLLLMIFDELGLMVRASSRVPEVTAFSPRGVPQEKLI